MNYWLFEAHVCPYGALNPSSFAVSTNNQCVSPFPSHDLQPYPARLCFDMQLQARIHVIEVSDHYGQARHAYMDRITGNTDEKTSLYKNHNLLTISSML